MDGAIASLAVEKLGELIKKEGELLWGVKGEVGRLRTQLVRFQGFLQAFDSRKGNEDSRIIEYVSEIRGVAYDAEDIIENYVCKVKSIREGRGAFHFLKRRATIFVKAANLHKIGRDIKALNKKVTDMRTSATALRVDLDLIPLGSSSNYDEQIERRRTYSHDKQEDTVGLQKDVDKIVDMVVNRENHVAIWGMGGLGKTTLAKKIFWDDGVRAHFDCFGWACVSQKCKREEVLKHLLIDLKSASHYEKEEIKKMDFKELSEQLYQLQKEKKCLVVLDDVWAAKDLQSVRVAFPLKTRSKIILTTRNKGIFPHIRTYIGQGCVLHGLQPLNEEESLQLFWKKASPTNSYTGPYDTNVEEIERKIVLRCQGLPLAIVVLGGIMAQKQTIQDWEQVLEDIPYYLNGGDGDRGGEVMQVLAFSFWDLPYYLKPCFLYLGQYPEDYEINIESLVRKWVAEGFVSHNSRYHQTLVDVARGYVDELAGRCMVELRLTQLIQRKKSCRLHDVVREFCLSMLDKQEDFLKILNVHQGSPSTSSLTQRFATRVRRLAIHMDVNGESSCGVDIKDYIGKPNHLRSVSYFNIGEFNIGELCASMECLFQGLKMVRVLDTERIQFSLPRMSRSLIGKLSYLRYLSIKHTRINELPSSIGELRFLQTLDLRSYVVARTIPNVLWKLKQLVHLYLPNAVIGPKMWLRLDTLTKLETLVNFDTEYCDYNCLLKLGSLNKLTTSLNNVDAIEMIVKCPSVQNNQLRHSDLTLKWKSTGERTQALVCQLLTCQQLHLCKLNLLSPLVRLPSSQEFLGTSSIVKLILHESKLNEDPMPILEKLPQLKDLSLSGNSFIGKNMVCSCGGFPQLNELSLNSMPNLEEWKVEKGSMPSLQNLMIFKCKKLKQLPEGLQYVTTLMKLFVHDQHLKTRASMGGEDHYKIKHVSKNY